MGAGDDERRMLMCDMVEIGGMQESYHAVAMGVRWAMGAFKRD